MSTEALIGKLAKEARPLQPLASPWRRALTWLLVSLPYVALIVAVSGLRGDLSSKLTEARFLIEQFGALLTGFMAALASFASVVPGYSRKYFLLPVVPLALWLGSVGIGCLIDATHSAHQTLYFHIDWLCFPGIVVVGLLPGTLIVMMLRRGAPLFPVKSTALAGLAAAGLGDFGFRLFHAEDAGLTVLVWQMGTVFLLTTVAAFSGRYVLNWNTLVRR